MRFCAGNTLLALAVLLATAFARYPEARVTGTLGFRHEAGVETKMLLDARVDVDAGPSTDVAAGAGFSLFEQAGLEHVLLGAGQTVLDRPRLRVAAEVSHNRWNDWQAAENRARVTVGIGPVANLEAEMGAAWRVPVLDGSSSPVVWSSPAAELNLAYRLEWTWLRRAGWTASAAVANFDESHFWNPQQFPVHLRASWRFGAGWLATAHAATGINGLSGLLLSVREVAFRAGVTRAF